MTIDWQFIESLEGSNVLQGYVPKDRFDRPIGKSGVTIGTGIDIGQLTALDLLHLLDRINPFPLDLFKNLRHYTDQIGTKALTALTRRPLEISKEDSLLLVTAMRAKVANQLAMQWKLSTLNDFSVLPAEAQTVLFSLAWNFGTNLREALPNTWLHFVDGYFSNSWGKVYEWLKKFPSKNPKLRARREKEAEYLKGLL